MTSSLDLATVEVAFFEPLVGQHYAARAVDLADQPPLDLELVQAQAAHQWAGARGRTPFSLLFRPGDPASLRQGTYEFGGSGVEGAAIFLVPVRDPQHGPCLEAVFN